MGTLLPPPHFLLFGTFQACRVHHRHRLVPSSTAQPTEIWICHLIVSDTAVSFNCGHVCFVRETLFVLGTDPNSQRPPLTTSVLILAIINILVPISPTTAQLFWPARSNLEDSGYHGYIWCVTDTPRLSNIGLMLPAITISRRWMQGCLVVGHWGYFLKEVCAGSDIVEYQLQW
jgi:hypothetical protein